jgi:cytosine/adenosine deaminase-related metal-dependent hydrolase
MKPGQPQISPLPPELAANGYAPAVAATLPRSRYKDCAIAGHALYSTSPEALGAAHAWCLDNKKTFSLHLAEFPEETELLLHGRGALYDYIPGVLLPGDWQPPRERPVVYAHALGLLGPQTLAIHCTQCTSEDVAVLASTGTSCCLCPRSNEYIGTGEAPAREMADAGILLCLGTDGLSSNDDLDITKEMNVAGKRWGFSRRAQLRMVTVNAAHALGISARLGSLEPGKSAFFSVFSEV